MALSLAVHKPVKRGGAVIGVRTNPYTRLSEDGLIIYVQNGQFFSEGGTPWEGDVPAWVYDRLEKMGADVRQDVKAPERPGKKPKIDPSLSTK